MRFLFPPALSFILTNDDGFTFEVQQHVRIAVAMGHIYRHLSLSERIEIYRLRCDGSLPKRRMDPVTIPDLVRDMVQGDGFR